MTEASTQVGTADAAATETGFARDLGSHAVSSRRDLPVWVIAAHPDRCPAEMRSGFADVAREQLGDAAPILVTCHRVEVYGAGGADAGARTLEALAARDPMVRGRIRLLTGDAAARHVLRLAAGLESAVVGEDQILHQVRSLRDSVRHGADPALTRLLELSIGTGRRARAHRPASRTVQTLATRAIDWLCLDGGLRRGGTLLVVGAGRMGALLAREGAHRGFRVTVASRSVERASAVASPLGASAVTLDESAAAATGFDGVAVALAGPWFAVAQESGRAQPPIVDLSSPPATLPAGPFDGPRIDIDGLYAWDRLPAGGEVAQYVEHAVALTEEALDGYRRWWGGRASLGALRTLRSRAERERRAHLERLLRRLPDLNDSERGLVEECIDQLVAALMHAPTARLRDDVDGSAAEAARRLFGIGEG